MPPTLVECWKRVFTAIPETARLLLGELKVEFAEGRIILTFANAWIRDYFTERYFADVQTRIAELGGKRIELVLQLSDTVVQGPHDSGNRPAGKETVRREPALVSEPAYTLKPRPGYTLDRFVVGESNHDAFVAATGLANGQINTLLVTGSIGIGKSHLLEGAIKSAKETYPGAKVLSCLPAKAFIGEFTRLAREKNQAFWEAFNRKYFSADWLCFDDVHQLAVGGGGTQRELKTIIESVLVRGAFIMLTSLRPLRELEEALVDQELISRLRGFLTVEIKPPDFDLKVAILVKKASEGPTPFNLDIGLARAIAKRVTVPDIRPLVGAVSSLKLRVSRGAVVDSELINELLGEVPQKKLDPDTITNIVAEHFFVSVEEILSKVRFKPVVRARHIAFYLCRELLTMSTTELGRYFRRDHSSIINGTDKIADRIKTDPDLQKELLAIESKIRSQEK